MQFPVAVFALLVESCLAGLIIDEASKGNRSSYLIGAVIKTLKSCYGNRLDAVCFAGDSDGILISTLFEESIPVGLLNNMRRLSGRDPVPRKSRHQQQIFVVAASSSTKLKEILIQVKDSKWWNHLASFIILNWPSKSGNECSNAYEILWAAWEFNLLNAKLMCLHRARELSIYGYNPYTNKAPDPWQLKKLHQGKNGHPWTLFARRFPGESLCEELDFDKTKDLGGYEVRTTAKLMPVLWSVDFNQTGADGFGGMFGNIAKILCRALKGSCKLILHDLSDSMLTKNGSDIALDVLNGISDIALNPRYQLGMANYTTTYPHWLSGLGVLTQYSGYVSQLNKINSVIDSTSRCGVCLVFFITLFFFKYVVRQATGSAILNNVRMVCNGSILNVPQNQAPRIYLASLFLFALTIQAIYQGKLASVLTKPVLLPNVNTMQDLANSHHTIYGWKAHATAFQDPIFKGRFVKLEYFDCVTQVRRNSSAACVSERDILIGAALVYKLYLSNDVISKDYWIYPIRHDWPLEERVNIILRRMVDANLVRYWHMKDLQEMVDHFQYYAKLKEDQKFEIITLNELSFAFAILGIGLGFATTIFTVEFIVHRALLRLTNVRVQSRS